MKFYLLIFCFIASQLCQGQQNVTAPPQYYSNFQVADSLCELKQYEKASQHVVLAFKAFGWKGLPEDRYKAVNIFALASNYDSAFENMRRLVKQEYINYSKVLNTPAIAGLRLKDSILFDSLVNKIIVNKKKFAPLQKLEWSDYLDSIYYEDQATRKKFQKAASIHGWDSPEAKTLLPEMKLKDSLNLIGIQNFIEKHGWLGKEIIGQQGNTTLFLVIQHAELGIQEKYIPIMRNAVKKHNANPADFALLKDRVAVAKYGYQVYGSQLHQDSLTKKMVFYPIRKEKSVDRRRKKIGLEPLAAYANRWGIAYIPSKK